MFTIRRSLVATAATVALAGIAAVGVAAPANAAVVSDRVAICKATGSSSNPYVYVQRSKASIVAKRYSANDIIPKFDYVADETGRTALFLGVNTVDTVVTPDCTPVLADALYM